VIRATSDSILVSHYNKLKALEQSKKPKFYAIFFGLKSAF
jgi:hypothetical protein